METSDFNQIFDRIRQLLVPYGKKMDVRADKPGNYQLYIITDWELAGRKFNECYFCGTTIKQTMVSFYFFPFYTHPDKLTIPEPIRKNLKGKTCFNFKKLDDLQQKTIAQLLQEGYELYKKQFKLSQ
jgi:hypothetical protein